MGRSFVRSPGHRPYSWRPACTRVRTGDRGVPVVGVLLGFDGEDEVTIAKVGDGAVVTRVVRQDIHAREPLPFDELDGVTVVHRDQTGRRLDATAVFAMIGASPRTEDLGGLVGLDDKGFIVTGEEAQRHQSFAEHRGDRDGQPLLLETTRPDVFAIGDVRSGSTKRVASAVGDGALVVRSLHEALARRRGAVE